MHLTKDRNGKAVTVGARVRLVTLSGTWVEELPLEERADVASMIGAVFTVEIDEDGDVWVEQRWDDGDGVSHGHSIRLDPMKWSLSMTLHDVVGWWIALAPPAPTYARV
jgi:hypothetical protein